MKNLFYSFLLLLCSVASKAQSTGCDAHVIAYKEGTSCTATPYRFYNVNPITGVTDATHFYELSATNREINGFGINPSDQKIYGIIYDRSPSCVFSNLKLFRLGNSGLEEIGVIPPPIESGVTGVVEAAFGTVGTNGDFIFRAYIVLGGVLQFRIGKISSLEYLNVGDPIVPEYKPMINAFSNRNYADWAIHPLTGELYTYTIRTGANGTPTDGQLAKLNPATLEMQLVGSLNTTEFLDAGRDNFGGIMFIDNDNMMGVNVHTRRLYKIEAATGNITFLNTVPISAGGQIRTDLGSCKSGLLILPIKINKFNVTTNNGFDDVSFELFSNNAQTINSIEVQLSNDGRNFNTVKQLGLLSNGSQKYHTTVVSTKADRYYRIKVTTNVGSHYSNIVKINVKEADLLLTANASTTQQIFYLQQKRVGRSMGQLTVMNTSGQQIYARQINIEGTNTSITVNHELPRGIYIATAKLGGNTIAYKMRVN